MSGGLARGEQAAHLRDGSRAGSALGDVAPVGEQRDSWASRAGSSASRRGSATLSSSARGVVTAWSVSAATRAASASMVSSRPARRERAPPSRARITRSASSAARTARRSASRAASSSTSRSSSRTTPSAERMSVSVVPGASEARLDLRERAAWHSASATSTARAPRHRPAADRDLHPPAREPVLDDLRDLHLGGAALARQADLHLAELVVDGADLDVDVLPARRRARRRTRSCSGSSEGGAGSPRGARRASSRSGDDAEDPVVEQIPRSEAKQRRGTGSRLPPRGTRGHPRSGGRRGSPSARARAPCHLRPARLDDPPAGGKHRIRSEEGLDRRRRAPPR